MNAWNGNCPLSDTIPTLGAILLLGAEPRAAEVHKTTAKKLRDDFVNMLKETGRRLPVGLYLSTLSHRVGVLYLSFDKHYLINWNNYFHMRTVTCHLTVCVWLEFRKNSKENTYSIEHLKMWRIQVLCIEEAVLFVVWCVLHFKKKS